MKYEVKFTTQFKWKLKLAKKQGKDIDKLFEVISTKLFETTIFQGAFFMLE